jgi:hypothetical protein
MHGQTPLFGSHAPWVGRADEAGTPGVIGMVSSAASDLLGRARGFWPRGNSRAAAGSHSSIGGSSGSSAPSASAAAAGRGAAALAQQREKIPADRARDVASVWDEKRNIVTLSMSPW